MDVQSGTTRPNLRCLKDGQEAHFMASFVIVSFVGGCSLLVAVLMMMGSFSPAFGSVAKVRDPSAPQKPVPAPFTEGPSIDPGMIHEPEAPPIPGSTVEPPVTDPEMAVDPGSRGLRQDAPPPEPIPDPEPTPDPIPMPPPDPPGPSPVP